MMADAHAVPDNSTVVSSVQALLHQKESELQSLRESSLRTLEEQLARKDSELQEAVQRLQQLQQDFDYNLQLLDSRDAELDQYDATFAAAAADIAKKDGLLEELRCAMVAAQSEFAADRKYFTEAAAAWETERGQLEEALSNATAAESAASRSCAESLRRETVLKRELAKARAQATEELETLQAATVQQLQDLKKRHADELDRVQEDAGALAHAVGEANAMLAKAEGREQAARREAEAVKHDLDEARASLAAREGEMEALQALKDALAEQLDEVHARHREQCQALGKEHSAHVQGLLSTIGGLEECVKELGAKPADLAEEFAAKVHGLEAELAVTQGKLQTAEAKLREATAGRLAAETRLESELGLVWEEAPRRAAALEKEMREKERAHEAELRAAVEDIWAKEQELIALEERARAAVLAQRLAQDAQRAAENALAKREAELADLYHKLEMVKETRSSQAQEIRSLQRKLARLSSKENRMPKTLSRNSSRSQAGVSLTSSPLLSPSIPSEPPSPSPRVWMTLPLQDIARGGQRSPEGAEDAEGAPACNSHDDANQVIVKEIQEENARLHAAVAALQTDVATLQKAKLCPEPSSRSISPTKLTSPSAPQPDPGHPPGSPREGDPSPHTCDEGGPPSCKSDRAEALSSRVADSADASSSRVADSAAQLEGLARELTAARARAATLATENERLMELSNKLRSQRDRAAILGFTQEVPNQDMQGPVPVMPLPRPNWHAQYIPPHFFNAGAQLYNIPPHMPNIPVHVWHGGLQQGGEAPEALLSLPGSQRRDDGGGADDRGEGGGPADVTGGNLISSACPIVPASIMSGPQAHSARRGQDPQNGDTEDPLRSSASGEAADRGDADLPVSDVDEMKLFPPLMGRSITASSRATPSQRAHLKALREKASPARPRIRNWNVKDP